MIRLDQNNAECLLYTFKEGLLSALAHDLKLRVERFHVQIESASGPLTAFFDPASVRVVCARNGDQDEPSVLSIKDRRDIDHATAHDVLEIRKHPSIELGSSAVDKAGDGYRIRADLTIKGRTRPVQIDVVRRGPMLIGRARLHQPDWGIKPFTALLGAMKIQPDVVVTVRARSEDADGA